MINLGLAGASPRAPHHALLTMPEAILVGVAAAPVTTGAIAAVVALKRSRLNWMAQGCPVKVWSATNKSLCGVRRNLNSFVPGLVPGIHVLRTLQERRGWPGRARPRR
jgi:hypothetical protein